MANDLLTLPSDQDASGRTLGAEEIEALAAAIATGTLTSTKGSFVKRLESGFAKAIGVKHAIACSSGTAAVHCAVAAIDPEPGDEIVTTAITDMGALTPILYQGAIPVFADVDPRTWNVTAATIERALSRRTKAVVVTHLFGNPCDMGPILELCGARGIPVIEDCAQSFGATWNGRPVGTIGTVGAWSLQQGKHITTGEGGLVTTDDDAVARRVFLFVNKAWGYGDANPDHYFLAPNYRMTELQGACGVAQLAKLEGSVSARQHAAGRFKEAMGELPGVSFPKTTAGGVHTFWKLCLDVDPAVVEGGPVGLAARLKERGIASAPRYIQKPAFRCQVFRDQVTFGKSRWPFTLARAEAVDYDEARFPGTFEGLARILVLPWNERYTDAHVDFIARSVCEAYGTLTGGAR